MLQPEGAGEKKRRRKPRKKPAAEAVGAAE
jgi:hypothetical protein